MNTETLFEKDLTFFAFSIILNLYGYPEFGIR